MPHRVALVHIPGWPLQELSFLLPGDMVFAAGLLRAAGVRVHLLDYGTPSALAGPAAAWQMLRTEAGWWQRRRAHHKLEVVLKEWRDKVIDEITAWGPDEILFFARDSASWLQARRIAETVHRRLSHIRLSAYGPVMPEHETLWKLWRAAEFSASRNLTLASCSETDGVDIETPACLYDSGKFSILPVAPRHSGFNEDQDAAEFRRKLSRDILRLRPGSAVWLAEDGGLQEWGELSERMIRRQATACSITIRPRSGMPSVMAELLRITGCVAVEIDALTGSQRLLEDVYSADFSVRDTRELARACREAGMRVLLRFASPGCWDDRHTFAECERLAEQCGCTGVSVAGTDSLYTPAPVSGIPLPSALEHYLATAGFPTGVRGWHIIAAVAAGYNGQENRWLRQFRQCLQDGDMDSLKSWIVICNRGLPRLTPAADGAIKGRLEAAAN